MCSIATQSAPIELFPLSARLIITNKTYLIVTIANCMHGTIFCADKRTDKTNGKTKQDYTSLVVVLRVAQKAAIEMGTAGSV